jgi:uncharacterized protein
MNSIPFSGQTELVFLSFDDGDLLLESIRECCKEHGIENGVILSCVAAIKTAKVHYIQHSEYPPTDITHSIDLPMEMTSMSGLIVDFEPHIHIGLVNGINNSFGGHLEEGTCVAYRGEIAIMKCLDADLTRLTNTRGIPVMVQKSKNLPNKD